MTEQARRPLRSGALLAPVALLAGLAIPALAVPRIGVAARVNGIAGGLALIALGLLWPHLRLGARALAAAFRLARYFFVATFVPLLGGARAGPGNARCWIDPTRGIGGVFATQILPFADEKALRPSQACERPAYGM